MLFAGDLAFTIELSASRFIAPGEDELARRAAVLVRGIILGHPFLDGNKRTGMACLSLVLERNGYELAVDETEGVEFALRVARGELSMDDLATWIHGHARKVHGEAGLP